jgi:hypothetical protein
VAYTFQTVTITIPNTQGPPTLMGLNDAGDMAGSATPVSGTGGYGEAWVQIGGVLNVEGAGGAPYGAVSNGGAINNSGHTVGASGHYAMTQRGFLYANGSFAEIDGPGNGYQTRAMGVNDSDVVVGSARVADSGAAVGDAAYVWQGGNMTLFNVPGAFASTATAINNGDEIGGYYTFDGTNDHGFVKTGATITTIDVPGAVSTQVTAIDNAGDIVGNYFDGNHWHGFIDAAGQMQFIDAPGADDTYIHAINNHGTIAGDYVSGGVLTDFTATPAAAPAAAVAAAHADPVVNLVREFYQGGLGRDADPGGLNFWTNELKAGALTPRDFVFAITGSSEGQARYGQQTDGQYVDSVYANALGRQADPGGQAAWTNLLQAGCARGDVMAAITQSPEGQQHFMLSHA